MDKRDKQKWTSELVWAAAYAAQRVNGNYVKTAYGSDGKKSNREIINSLLLEPSLITKEDIAGGELVRTHYRGLMFKVLAQGRLNDFENTAMLIANKDVIDSNYDIAVVASLPSCYQRDSKRSADTEKIRDTRGGYVGTVGDKISTNVKILGSTYSQKWAVWYVTAITDADQAILFGYRESLDEGKVVAIKGTVKSHRSDNITQLNRVKIQSSDS